MLHLEALENRCLLSNNGALVVLAAAAATADDIMTTDASASEAAAISSLTVSDDTGITDDRLVDFGNVPLGRPTAAEYVTITNDTGSTINLSKIELTGDGFSLGYDRPLAYPIGFSDDSNIEIRQFSKSYVYDYTETNWATFKTTGPGEFIISSTIYGVYDQYGQPVDTFYNYSSTNSYYSMYAPTAGTYYLKLYSVQNPTNTGNNVSTTYSISVVRNSVSITETDFTPATSTLTHDNQSRAYKVNITEPTNITLVAEPKITPEFQSYLDTKNIIAGDYATAIATLKADGVDNVLLAYPMTTLYVYNQDGHLVYSNTYNDNNNLEGSSVGLTPFPAEEISLLESGNYTFYYQFSNEVPTEYLTDESGNIQQGNDGEIVYEDIFGFWTGSLEFSVTNSGSAFELENNESLKIPVTFRTTTHGVYDGQLSITQTDGAKALVDLDATATSGDLYIYESSVNADYPENLQKGSIVRVNSLIVNPINITYRQSDAADIYYYNIDPEYNALNNLREDYQRDDTLSRIRRYPVSESFEAGIVNADVSLEYYLLPAGSEDIAENRIALNLVDTDSNSLDLLQYLSDEYGRSAIMFGDSIPVTANLEIPFEAEGLDLDSYDLRVRMIQGGLNYGEYDDKNIGDAATSGEETVTLVEKETDKVILSNDIAAFDNIEFNKYRSLVFDAKNIMVRHDDVDDDVDFVGGLIEFGETAINKSAMSYVEIVNRSPEPLFIENVSFTSDTLSSYRVSMTKSGEYMPTDNFIIGAGQSQRVYVVFNPKEFPVDFGSLAEGETASLTATLNITTEEGIEYHVDITGETTGADLQILENTGVAANDDIVLLPDSRPNQSVVTSMTTITLENWGDRELVISEAFFGNNSPFILGQNLSFVSIPVGGSLEVPVYFNPKASGAASSELTIRSNDQANNGEYIMTFYATGIYPVVTVEENSGVVNNNSINFGNNSIERVDAVSEQVRIINNNAAGFADVLYISNIATNNPAFEVNVVGDDGSLISVDQFITGDYYELAVGDELILDVRFQAETVGDFVGRLSVETVYPVPGTEQIDTDKTYLVSLGGSIAEPLYSLRDEQNSQSKISSVDFGQMIISGALSAENMLEMNVVTFNIEGTAPIYIDTISLAGAGTDSGFSLVGSDGSIIVTDGVESLISLNKEYNPGDKIYLRVIFDASGHGSGEYLDSIVITGDSEISYPIKAELITSDIATEGSAVVFADTQVGYYSSQLVTITNSGQAPLVVSGFESSDIQFSLTESSFTIAPNSQRDIEVKYMPNTVAATQAVISLLTNDPENSYYNISVVGNSAGNILNPSKISGNNYTYIFNNADGDRVRLNIRYVAADIDGSKASDLAPAVYLDRAGASGNIALIEMPHSTTASRIVVSGDVSIAGIEAGSMASISGKFVDFSGNINLNGSISTIKVDDIMAGTVVTVSNSETVSRPVNIVVDTVAENSVFNIDANLRTFQASDFSAGTDSAVNAHNINKLVIRKGDLGASVTSYDSIRTVSVKNDILDNILAYNSIGSINVGSDISSDSLIIAGDSSLVQDAKSGSAGNIARVSVGGDIDGDIRALNGDIGKILANRGNINGGIFADNVKILNARNISGARMAIGESVGKFSVKYDIIDSVIGVGYDFSSLPSSREEVTSLIDNQNTPGDSVIGRYSIGGKVAGNSIVTFI